MEENMQEVHFVGGTWPEMTAITFDLILTASTKSLTTGEAQECSLLAQKKKKNSGEYPAVITSWYQVQDTNLHR